jgi:hypothetical protein
MALKARIMIDAIVKAYEGGAPANFDEETLDSFRSLIETSSAKGYSVRPSYEELTFWEETKRIAAPHICQEFPSVEDLQRAHDGLREDPEERKKHLKMLLDFFMIVESHGIARCNEGTI